MKKVIVTLCACFLVSGVWAQLEQGAKVITASQTKQAAETTINGNPAFLQFQVGLPFIVDKTFNIEEIALSQPERYTSPFTGSINFPWNVLYLYNTFSEETTAFDVSKGYFGDKVLLRWELKSNFDNINYIKIYRRLYTETTSGNWVFLSNVSKDNTQYEDLYIDGGVLYEYKVEADGIVGDEYLQKYITGIGFRSPTAVVTGNVNYDGGSPVKDVTVTAEADGSAVNLGAALKINDNGFLEIPRINKAIENATTMQGW